LPSSSNLNLVDYKVISVWEWIFSCGHW